MTVKEFMDWFKETGLDPELTELCFEDESFYQIQTIENPEDREGRVILHLYYETATINKVYVLLVTRHGGVLLDDTHIDSIHSSEEGVWSRIEKKFYKYVEAVRTIGYEVHQIKFYDDGLLFEYKDPLTHIVGSIRYEFQERLVDCCEHADLLAV